MGRNDLAALEQLAEIARDGCAAGMLAESHHPFRAVDERQTLLEGEMEGLDAGCSQRPLRGTDASIALDFALSDKGQCQVRERSEVARRSERSLGRHRGVE